MSLILDFFERRLKFTKKLFENSFLRWKRIKKVARGATSGTINNPSRIGDALRDSIFTHHPARNQILKLTRSSASGYFLVAALRLILSFQTASKD